jgi:PAS domain S-box-containing protein
MSRNRAGPAGDGAAFAIVGRGMWERRLAAYSLAVVATVAAAMLRGLLSRWLGFEYPYITFFGAIMVAAWYGGWRPGILATVLSAATTALWFIDAGASAIGLPPADVIAVILFLLIGALISAACEQLHQARWQIERQNQVLAGEVRARADAEQGATGVRRVADRAEALLAAVVESSEDAILTKSVDGHILSWNRSAERMFGYTAADVIGGLVTRLVPVHRQDEEMELLRRVSQGEPVVSFETERVARDGRVFDVSVTLSPIRDDGGQIVGASSIVRDVTARKALEASLRDADRRKDDFLAVLAHELRNPLSPIRNSAALLKLAGAADPMTARAAAVIERQAQHMGRLLDDLLDVSRITRDRLELRRAPVILRDILDAAVETVRPSLDALEQPVTTTLPEAPVQLDGDPVRLAQVFGNILNNASKYSERGGAIRITAAVEDDEVTIAIADQGVGIAPEMLPHVFEMFSQASQSISRSQGGMGIGLALVKGLVELHGGRVTAESAGQARGSRFTVTLPVAAASGAASAPAAPGTRARRRVLVVDDNRDHAESLAQLLRAHGHGVRTAYDGGTALAEARRFHPHVVLLDLGMPDMDGLETARRLRAGSSAEPRLLVAVTGWGQERDRVRTREAGFDGHLVKPVDLTELEALMQSAPALMLATRTPRGGRTPDRQR